MAYSIVNLVLINFLKVFTVGVQQKSTRRKIYHIHITTADTFYAMPIFVGEIIDQKASGGSESLLEIKGKSMNEYLLSILIYNKEKKSVGNIIDQKASGDPESLLEIKGKSMNECFEQHTFYQF